MQTTPRYKREAEEFIEMHGYDVTDHGNRGLYHAINRYTTMDRFAEKYPWQSPYVHAGNNPVNTIDVKGDSTYHINSDGYVTMVNATDDNYDELYVVDANGNVITDVNPLRVNEQSILSGLSQKRDDYKGSYAVNTSDEIGNVFVFAANNSNVEWGLAKFKGGDYVLTTSNEKAKVGSVLSINGYDEKNMNFMLHSHPGSDGTKGASFIEYGGPRTDMHNIVDMAHRFNNAGRYTANNFPKHFIYHPHSRNLYQYTPYENTINIGTVNSSIINIINKRSYNSLYKK